jgi:phage terminase small subunit
MADDRAGIDTVTGGLTLIAQRFCAEYVNNGGNGKAAARVAGYNSPKTASRLMSNPAIRRRIDELRADEAARLALTKDAVRQELAKVAFSRMDDVADWADDGTVRVKSRKEMGARGRASLHKLQVVEEINKGVEKRTMTIERESKVSALSQLAKLLEPATYSGDGGEAGGIMDEIDASKLDHHERVKLRELLLKARRSKDE